MHASFSVVVEVITPHYRMATLYSCMHGISVPFVAILLNNPDPISTMSHHTPNIQKLTFSTLLSPKADKLQQRRMT